MLGKFVVLEGIDGSGKDTQVELLKQFFASEGKKVVEEGEELYSWNNREFVFVQVLDENFPETSELRQVLFGKGKRFVTWAEIFIFWADKFQMLYKHILPNLEKGRIVVANRWEISQMAYQVHGKQNESLREISLQMRSRLDQIATPDLHILLDVSIEESKKRMEARAAAAGNHNFFDDSKKEFFERVSTGYLEELKQYSYQVVDANQTKNKVYLDLLNILKR
jgi:dTMP kinase